MRDEQSYKTVMWNNVSWGLKTHIVQAADKDICQTLPIIPPQMCGQIPHAFPVRTGGASLWSVQRLWYRLCISAGNVVTHNAFQCTDQLWNEGFFFWFSEKSLADSYNSSLIFNVLNDWQLIYMIIMITGVSKRVVCCSPHTHLLMSFFVVLY